MFTKQVDAANAAGANVVVRENVDGVATLAGGIALKQLIDNVAKAGFTQLFHKKITFALFGDPENRSRRVIVAFHDSVTLIDNVAKAGFTQLFHKKITFALFGDPENRSRRVIVAFHDSVTLSKQSKWPEPPYKSWSLNHGDRMCAGEVLFPSTVVPARFWDDRSWHKVQKSWTGADDLRIRTVGYKNLKDSIGLPMEPSTVWATISIIFNFFGFRQLRSSAHSDAESIVSIIYHVH